MDDEVERTRSGRRAPSKVIFPMPPRTRPRHAAGIFEIVLHDRPAPRSTPPSGSSSTDGMSPIDRPTNPRNMPCVATTCAHDVACGPVLARRRRRPPSSGTAAILAANASASRARNAPRSRSSATSRRLRTPSSASSNTRRQPVARDLQRRELALGVVACSLRLRSSPSASSTLARASAAIACSSARVGRGRDRVARRRRCPARRRSRSARARGSRPTARSCGRSTCRRCARSSPRARGGRRRSGARRRTRARAGSRRRARGPSSVATAYGRLERARSRRRRRRAAGARARSRRAVSAAPRSSSSAGSTVSSTARGFGRVPRWRCTDASTTAGNRVHALVGHRARDLVEARERRRRTRRRDRARRAARTTEPGRHHLAPAVADLLEQLDRVAAALDALARPPAPQRDVREQHVHHPDRPAVAGLAAFDRDVLGDRGGLVEAALVVADEREQPVRPAEPAPVAELAEQVGRLLEPVLGARDVAVRERDPREVLQRPRRAALGCRTSGTSRAPPTRTVRLARGRRGRGAIMPSPRSTLAAPDSSPSSRHMLERLAERRLGDVVRAGRGLAFAEQRQRHGLAVPVVRRRAPRSSTVSTSSRASSSTRRCTRGPAASEQRGPPRARCSRCRAAPSARS